MIIFHVVANIHRSENYRILIRFFNVIFLCLFLMLFYVSNPKLVAFVESLSLFETQNTFPEAEFKEIEPRLKFYLKLYSIFQYLSWRRIETSFWEI